MNYINIHSYLISYFLKLFLSYMENPSQFEREDSNRGWTRSGIYWKFLAFNKSVIKLIAWIVVEFPPPPFPPSGYSCFAHMAFLSFSQANDHRDTEVSDCTLLTSLKRSSSCSKSCYGRGAMTPGDSSLMLKSLTKGMSRFVLFSYCNFCKVAVLIRWEGPPTVLSNMEVTFSRSLLWKKGMTLGPGDSSLVFKAQFVFSCQFHIILYNVIKRYFSLSELKKWNCSQLGFQHEEAQR